MPATARTGSPDLHCVATDALHLRTAPEVRPTTRLAVLPRGHVVERVDEGETPGRAGWWRVTTEVDGVAVTGFLAARFVSAVEVRAALVADCEPAGRELSPPPQAHLSHGLRSVRRSRAGGRAHPIGEPGAPRRDARRPEADRARAVERIVDWLDVESSPRYLPAGGSTFCNIYACDCCYLAGAYLPRVWWTGPALAEFASGGSVEPRYATTVRELTANDLFDWLREWGPRFGWRRTFDAAEARAAATGGAVGVVCAQRRDRARPGHISVLLPDPKPPRDGAPLHQSQAGSVNRRRFRRRWWRHDRFREHGFFLHP